MFHWTGLDHVLAVSGIALAIMTAISLIVGWFVAGRMLSPLRAMTTTARRISERNLHQRLAVPGPRYELKDLGDTIDSLLDRLETVVAAQRQFAANASHELRTPSPSSAPSSNPSSPTPGPPRQRGDRRANGPWPPRRSRQS